MAFTLSTIYKAIDKFSPVVKKMQKINDGFNKRMMTGLNKVNRALGGFGIALGAAGLVGAAGKSIKVFSDFEQSGANLASILNKTKIEIRALTDDAKRLGATTAFTASEVSALQTEFAKLGFSEREILNATQSTLALAAATKTELPQAAAQVGAAIRAFGLDASEATRVADVFAASTSKSALDMEKLNTAMSIVAPVAKQFNFSLEDSTALLGKLSDAGFDASSAATATRNIILNLADSNGKLAKALGKPVKDLPSLINGLERLRNKGVNLNQMLKLTDKRSVAAFSTFVDNAKSVQVLSDELKNAGGFAQRMADKQLDTLQGSVIKLKSAWEGFILSLEDGTGKFSMILRKIVDVGTEMLSMASGTSVAKEQLSGASLEIRLLAEKASNILNIIKNVVIAFISFKIALTAIRVASIAYNTVLGIMLAFQNSVPISLAANSVAMKAYSIATNLATGAVKLFNLAFKATPLGWIALAIGVVIGLFKHMKDRWEGIKKAFKEQGFLGGIKAFGKAILSFILTPVKWILKAIGKLTGAKWANEAVDKISMLDKDLLVDSGNNTTVENPVDIEKAKLDRYEEITKNQIGIELTNKTDKNANVNFNPAMIPVTSNTF